MKNMFIPIYFFEHLFYNVGIATENRADIRRTTWSTETKLLSWLKKSRTKNT